MLSTTPVQLMRLIRRSFHVGAGPQSARRLRLSSLPLARAPGYAAGIPYPARVQIPDHQYTVDQCSVPVVRRPALDAERTFRHDCQERLHREADTSVPNQVLYLTWNTLVFRTLNECRRLELTRSVNGAMWELMTAGYSNIITLGIRRLGYTHPNADSVCNAIGRIERRPELLHLSSTSATTTYPSTTKLFCALNLEDR